MKTLVWLNGKVVKDKNARISVFDRSFLYGDGLFETMRAYGGRVFRLDRHIARLFAGSKVLNIKLPYGEAFLKNIISRLVEKLRAEDTYVRIAATRGEGKIGLDSAYCKRPNVILRVSTFRPYPDSFYKKGAEVIVSSVRRNNYSPVSSIKSNNYLNSILALTEAKDKGRDDAIMLNADGFVAESTSGNIFMIKGKRLLTPGIGEGLLAGITRGAVIGLAPRAGLKVVEKRLTVTELKKADEIFLTNSIVEIRGITSVDRAKISGSKPGPVTRLLHRFYTELVRRELNIR